MSLSFKKTTVSVDYLGSKILYYYQTLPINYAYSHEYDTPHRFNPDTWNGAVLNFIESTYRSYNLKGDKYFEGNYTLNFSNDALETSINYFKDLPGIPHQKKLFNATTFLHLMSNNKFRKSFVPTEFCNYIDCNNMTNIITENNFELEFIYSKRVMFINGIKHLISDSEQPLFLTIPNPYLIYDNQLQLPLHYNSFFYTPKSMSSLECGNPITMLLYGWDEEYFTHIKKPIKSPFKNSKGGFVVKISDQENGNAIGLYDGSLTSDDNRQLCWNDNDPKYWTSDDILICINENYCNSSFQYRLCPSENTDEQDLSSGKNYSVQMFRIVNETYKEEFDFEMLPFEMLNIAFGKKEKSKEMTSDKTLCGYSFLPFDLLEMLISKCGYDPLKQVQALYLATRWKKSSYIHKNISMDEIHPRAVSVV
ncbi:hypothetical protein GPJ56_002389 [Histomonas meleagridis]|uniref:uncharacterized protein n=1 Tax=Histomonas meleagridis TaxID=135588 RepID=UPI003559E5C8|nr:hypothetical protein GPJ56_002389 [Histomonas meleagridis]KAH0801879.1 hypothetical protein GO595_005297 [Histomonas meleagridis]